MSGNLNDGKKSPHHGKGKKEQVKEKGSNIRQFVPAAGLVTQTDLRWSSLSALPPNSASCLPRPPTASLSNRTKSSLYYGA